MSRSRLLVFDLDGTLLDGSRCIPSEARELLFRLRAEGIAMTLATGRPFAAMKRFVDELHLDLPVIVFNGAVVASPSGETLWSERLPKRVAAFALKLLEDSGLSRHLYLEAADDHFYTDRIGAEAKHIMGKDGIDSRVDGDLLALVEGRTLDPIKLFSIGDPEALERIQRVFQVEEPDYTCVHSEHDMLEFLGASVTKGAALHVLCRQIDVPVETTVAFGDNMNDLELLREAGVGVAMAHGPSTLRDAADEVAQDVAGFLREHFCDTLEETEEQHARVQL